MNLCSQIFIKEHITDSTTEQISMEKFTLKHARHFDEDEIESLCSIINFAFK